MSASIIDLQRSTLVNDEKYIGLDVHQATISAAVMDQTGKIIMECIVETKAATILELFAGLRGTLAVTFEERTSAAWFYDLLRPHVARVVVCSPRKNALLKQGNKNDSIDARKLAELLRGNSASSTPRQSRQASRCGGHSLQPTLSLEGDHPTCETKSEKYDAYRTC